MEDFSCVVSCWHPSRPWRPFPQRRWSRRRPSRSSQPADLNVIKQLPIVAKAQLERAGFKVEVQATDWTTMVNRLVTKKGPPSEGG